MKPYLPLLLMFCLFSGCGVFRPGIHGSGITQFEYRQVAPFEQVKLAGIGTVNISVGESQSVCVRTDNNLLEHVDTIVDNGQLKIKPRQKIRPSSDLIVDVTVPRLTAAKVSGAGDIHVANMIGDRLDMSISGAGTVTANGHVNHLSASISGAGTAELDKLYAGYADVDISGAGSADVFATESVDAKISGAGSVNCFGNPKHVNKKVSGIGNITIPRNDDSVRYSIGDEGAYGVRER